MDLRARSSELCTAFVRLLGHKTLYGCGAVHVVDGRVDARLYRTVFLVATEAVFQMGLAHVVRGRNPAAVASSDQALTTNSAIRSGPFMASQRKVLPIASFATSSKTSVPSFCMCQTYRRSKSWGPRTKRFSSNFRCSNSPVWASIDRL